MRSVYQLWLRNGNNTALQSYITSFAAVQVDPLFLLYTAKGSLSRSIMLLRHLGQMGRVTMVRSGMVHR
jgi:hypothetical protein